MALELYLNLLSQASIKLEQLYIIEFTKWETTDIMLKPLCNAYELQTINEYAMKPNEKPKLRKYSIFHKA